MSKVKACILAAGVCKVGLFLIVLGLVAQGLDHFFYTVPYDRAFYLGMAFVLTFAMLRTFRAMATQVERNSGYRAMRYASIMEEKIP